MKSVDKVNRGMRISSIRCNCVVCKLIIIVSWRRLDWGKSQVFHRYWKSEGHWATWFRCSVLLWSSYQLNSSTLHSFNKALLMLYTARPSACVLSVVFVGGISSCGLWPAQSIDCNPHDICCMEMHDQMFWAHIDPHIRGTEEIYPVRNFMLFPKKNFII